MSAATLNGQFAPPQAMHAAGNGNGIATGNGMGQPLAHPVTSRHAGQVYAGLVPTITRYLEVKAWQRECEAEGRRMDKEAKTLEKSLTDALEANGGTMEAGDYRLSFAMVPGVPSYKGICERHIAPAVLLAEVNATPQRQKLVIDS
jgi:hypothetical protein